MTHVLLYPSFSLYHMCPLCFLTFEILLIKKWNALVKLFNCIGFVFFFFFLGGVVGFFFLFSLWVLSGSTSTKTMSVNKSCVGQTYQNREEWLYVDYQITSAIEWAFIWMFVHPKSQVMLVFVDDYGIYSLQIVGI